LLDILQNGHAAPHETVAMSLKRQFECGGRVALLTLDRPAARNAIDPEMRAALANAFAKIEADDNIWAKPAPR
jgi:enoyl-CoA hydratase/carnithine racemase